MCVFLELVPCTLLRLVQSESASSCHTVGNPLAFVNQEGSQNGGPPFWRVLKGSKRNLPYNGSPPILRTSRKVSGFGVSLPAGWLDGRGGRQVSATGEVTWQQSSEKSQLKNTSANAFLAEPRSVFSRSGEGKTSDEGGASTEKPGE